MLDTKKAFSVTEILIALLVVSVIFAASAPMISKRISPVANLSTEKYLESEINTLKNGDAARGIVGLEELGRTVCAIENELVTKCSCSKSEYCKRKASTGGSAL